MKGANKIRAAVLRSECIMWPGQTATNGYGRIRIGGAMRPAHRVIYEAAFGKIKAGLVMDHLCRNRRCINPAHLEPVTNKENIRRGIGPAAENARKTKCIHGHPFSGKNLRMVKYTSGRVSRGCRECHKRQLMARYREVCRIAKKEGLSAKQYYRRKRLPSTLQGNQT